MSQFPKSLQSLAASFPVLACMHYAKDGGYWIESPQLGGCFASGDTPQEAAHNFKFAIYEYFDVPEKYHKPEWLMFSAVELPLPTAKQSEPVSIVQSPSFALSTR